MKTARLTGTHPRGRIAQRYLVTGGAGFIGSHLCEYLLARGRAVAVIDDLSTGCIGNIRHLRTRPRFSFVRASITDIGLLNRLAAKTDVIVHLAAAVGVEKIIDDPVGTIETNVMGTEVVLKAALRRKCRVVVASTSEVYGKGIKVPFSEADDVLLGATDKSRWGYAASKMVDEFLALAYWREYRLPVVILRFFNTIGVRQTGQYGMVVPRFIACALRGQPIQVYGSGRQSRCFCDVQDVVRAVTALANEPRALGQVINIGSQAEISIGDLARKIKRIAGSASPIVKVPYDKAYAPGFEDMQRRIPDISKIRRLIGWQPQIALDDTLAAVIADMRGAR